MRPISCIAFALFLAAPLALPAARFAVVKPPQGLDTARIFGDPLLKRSSEPAIISGFAATPSGQGEGIPGGAFAFHLGRNDLQPVAERLCPAVTEALQWLRSQGLEGRMTGSGSAVFAWLGPGKAVEAAPAGWQVRECGNLEVHPLLGWAPSDDSSVGGVKSSRQPV